MVSLRQVLEVAEAGPQRQLPASSRRQALREAAGLSRSAVAAVVGVSERTVASWEQGRTFHWTFAPRYRRVLTFLSDERPRTPAAA